MERSDEQRVTVDPLQALYDDCVELYRRTAAEVTYVWPSGKVGPYWARRFQRKIKRDHEDTTPSRIVESVSEMVSKLAPQGFGIIEEAGRLDLSLELLVLDEDKTYHSLFSPEVIAAAAERMEVYYARQSEVREHAKQNGQTEREHAVAAADGDSEELVQAADSKPPEDDLGRLLVHIERLGAVDEWEAQTTYETVPLAAVDSIWSLGVNYQHVLNVLQRLDKHAAQSGRDFAALETSGFVALVESTGGPDALAAHVKNRQRTSARSGILKSDAVYRAARILKAEGIEHPADLHALSERDLAFVERRWRYDIPGQSSGISWTYFLMLLDMPGVKADRMVCRFVADALGVPERAVPPRKAQELVTDAAYALEVDPRHLDFNIWNYQRGQSR
jgi:hypothetical protein